MKSRRRQAASVGPRLRARIRVVDLLSEAVSGITRRPMRSALTALGTVVGVGAFVATTGLASTAAAQIGQRFDALKATEVRVQDAQQDGTNPFPDDTDTRLEALNGVNHAGEYWTITTQSLDPRLLPTRVGRTANAAPIPVIAATPGAVLAAIPVLQQGRLFDWFHQGRSERVAVLGRAAAKQLGIARVDDQPAVFIGDIGYTVIGIIDDVARNPDLLLSITIPASTAIKDLPSQSATYQVLIDVAPGAAQLIGHQAALALRPDNPQRLQTLVPPDPRLLRQGVQTDITSLFYALAGLALFIGMIGIANTTLVAIIERQHEIAVRRALGARRRHIAGQVLTESAMLGTIGGIVGTSIALIAITIVSASKQWTTTIQPWIPLAAPLVGTVTGLLAGLQPAHRATRNQPAETLR